MPQERVEAVERALSIVSAFSDGDQALSLAEIARRTGLYKSTILRLAGSLKRFGYLSQQADGAYRLGPSLWRFGAMYRRAFLSAEAIAPVLLRLREATGETASFYVRDGDERVCLYRVNSERPLRHHLDEGARLPLDRGAAGRLLLACEGGAGAHAGADGGADGEEIRAQGHAISLGERDPEIAAVAVPVFAAGGDILGALTISGLVTRFDAPTVARCLAALKAEARRLSS